MMSKAYCGVGSRKTPPEILKLMENIGEKLAKKDFVLRSGGAAGADTAFEIGCDRAKGKKEIFRPRNVPRWAYDTVQNYLPEGYNWGRMRHFVKALLARDMQQVLGKDGDDPSEFIICWTPDGRDSGGTGYAIRCAEDKDIPVYNLHSVTDRQAVQEMINEKI